jgi:galactonate dehydratase
MSPDPVRNVTLTVAPVTPKTKWIFVEVTTASGLKGLGEGTLTGREEMVAAATRRLAEALFAQRDATPDALPAGYLTGLPEAAAFSALDHALWDIEAQRQGTSLAAALGEVRRDAVLLYANINRRTLDRTPAGFAASAREALSAGHLAFKIAPFDEVTPAARRAGETMVAIEPGLARIRAVREAIGPGLRLMVDCHWRLDEPATLRVIAAAAEAGVHWVECPLPETADMLPALRRLRGVANRAGLLLAGCEECIRLEGFQPFIDAGAYDVLMPDAKYVGGLREMLRLAEVMHRSGIAFSPHNPSGPVCHVVSMHVAAVVPNLHSLESQYDETPLFHGLAGKPVQDVVAGEATMPGGPGLGITLQPVAVETRSWVDWQAE